ncbi:MAG: M14 family metallopeptidase [Myxococcota bacterium]|nr:M14 family metallopeptidase [Myxococcota bacterium]
MTNLIDANLALSPYRTLDAVYEATVAHTKTEGMIRHTIGRSVEGRPIDAIQIKSSSTSARSVLVCANIHGVEFIAVEVALGLLKRAAEGCFRVAELLQKVDLWIIPTLNPDAYFRTWQQQGQGVLAELRTNANGVDLNRNYPRPSDTQKTWLKFGGWRLGSQDPTNAFYRGASALSEPETRALATLHDQVDFVASANLHSTMGTLIQPRVLSRRVYKHYGALINAFKKGQTDWRYKRMANMWFDRFTGEQEDFQHHCHNTWALCVEHYPVWVNPWRFWPTTPLFWRFNPRRPGPYVDSDIGGILSYFECALTLPRPHDICAHQAINVPTR